MKKWIKWLSVILCLYMALSMAACTPGGADDTTGGTEEPTDNQTQTDTVITTAAESYTVVEGEKVNLNADFTSSSVGISLSYTSDDESVATVSKYGKVTGISEGTTTITITSSDGATKTVTVTVEDRVVEQVLRVALNVMYNDMDLGCYNNETGPVIEITQDGQYTVTFDCADLSEATSSMGITGLNNLTSIYIKDYDVTVGNLTVSNVTACQIRWDKVVVDGVELTITNGEFKDAMKATGIFDTNDPFNAWDGSSVAEVTTDTTNHVLNINLDNPQTVSVTFTISGLTFAE